MKLKLFKNIHTHLWIIYSPKRNQLYHYYMSIGFSPESSYLSAKNISIDAVNFLIK